MYIFLFWDNCFSNLNSDTVRPINCNHHFDNCYLISARFHMNEIVRERCYVFTCTEALPVQFAQVEDLKIQ